MKIGFTGTRKGMTDIQKHGVEYQLWLLTYHITEFSEVHHGDCVGADVDFHYMAIGKHIPITIHPSNLRTRAYCQGAVLVHEPKPPLVRDHDIVDSVDVMIATPAQDREILRSGTWATIRYAKKVGRVIHIIYPNVLPG